MNDLHEGPLAEGERKWKAVYTIIDRSPGMGAGGGGRDRKAVWVRVGTAFVNRDQSLNVRLDAVPTNGTLHIRDYVPPDETRRGDDRMGPSHKGLA